MRVPSYEWGARRRQRAFLRLTRAAGAEIDDVGKVSLRRPDFFGRPFLGFAQILLRGSSTWSVGERELFAAVVSSANSCAFCVGTHSEIAAMELGRDAVHAPSARAAAASVFLETLTRDASSVSVADVERARGAGVDDDALAEAMYVAFFFNTMNRVADALDFHHPSDRARIRGAAFLRRLGYRVPRFLLR